jgi:hypothetical protein
MWTFMVASFEEAFLKLLRCQADTDIKSTMYRCVRVYIVIHRLVWKVFNFSLFFFFWHLCWQTVKANSIDLMWTGARARWYIYSICIACTHKCIYSYYENYIRELFALNQHNYKNVYKHTTYDERVRTRI